MNKKTTVLLVVILLIIVIAIFFIILKVKQDSLTSEQGDTFKPFWKKGETIKPTVNKEDYQNELKRIIDYLMVDTGNQQIVKEAMESILALQVPADYRQLHLDLVIAITHLEDDQEAAKELEEIVVANDWLK